MSITRPTGDQLQFNSASTGEHVLDAYLEAAERGSKTLGQLIGDIFTNSGEVSPALLANVPFTQSGAGAVTRSLESKTRESVSVRDFGAVGDGVTDDTVAIQAALNSVSSSGGSVFLPRGVYRVSSTITIPSRVHFYGEGDISQIEWGGAVPAPGSKTPVVRVSSSNPVTTALANARVSDMMLDLQNTANLVGFAFVFASFQSRGDRLRVDDVGVNGIGFRFAKLWYAAFDTLSVRCATKNSGSVGFLMDTSSIDNGYINGVHFLNLQANKTSVGLHLDTEDYLVAVSFRTLVLEQHDVCISHFGRRGVRQMKFEGVYLEDTPIMVDWQRDPGATDTSQQILWENVQTEVGSSVWNIAEGRHWLRGIDSITTLNNSGAQIRVEGDAGISVVNTGAGRTLVIPSPSNMPQGSSYANVLARPQAVRSVRNVVAAATTVTTIPLPADLVNSTFPTYGREIKLAIFCRKWSNTQNRWWEGYLVQRDNQTWALFKAGYSSAEDAAWSVAVNGTTGELTVTYTDVSEGKIIIADFWPL
jgi:hypothetical protein